MKRVGDLFPRVWAYDNLLLAAQRAQCGKRYRADVLDFNFRRDDLLHELSRSLRDGTWRPHGHRHFLIFEPKRRWISAAPYADRVVHHAVCQVIGPELDRRLIDDCWANRVGKGTHRAVLRYQRFAGRHPYALKMDIRQYFPSVDHLLLKGQLRRVFKDAPLLALLDAIVDAADIPECPIEYFPGDTLFTPFERRHGLPIGNLTSQLWANTYLATFDHWVKEELGVRGNRRIVGDFSLLGNDAQQLLESEDRVRAYLLGLRLQEAGGRV